MVAAIVRHGTVRLGLCVGSDVIMDGLNVHEFHLRPGGPSAHRFEHPLGTGTAGIVLRNGAR